MKALFTFIFVGAISFTLFAQENDKKQTPEKSRETQKEELTSEEDTTKTKSFTLDSNDAVVEEVEASEPYEAEEFKKNTNKSYHYSHYRRNDDIQTLAGKNGHHGGFGAVTFRASEFNNKDIIMAGFRGGWIINRALAIGFEGHGIIPTAEYESIDPTNPLNSRSVGGYGGIFLEPIVLSNKVVHVTFPVSGGAGWLGYIVDWEQNNYYADDLIDDDIFWYIEPGAAVELNVARNFRINMGASYRFIKDLELLNTSSSAFDAWNYFLTLKFGRF